ncbi:hypothetical protein B0H17DRAFT_393143 [Mycena rosella]|uniref:Uncharacterized protein n=1 Tax=Mycena rosella TaxID=1033263 RepID=A0AAD7GLP8_MYCRO|nr:hypothetical protein B0H17DRAFT_393143 [Mycena rosella]
MSSAAPYLGMPGGSWAFEEERPTSCFQVPHASVVPNGHGRVPEDTSRFTEPTQKSQTPQTVHSEIVTIDPAKLSEEVVLLASPTSTASREMWRVRISPEYDIQVLPPDPHGSDMVNPRRDSPQQRRSRHLNIVYPEFQDYIHSASRGSTNNAPLPSVLDIEWDFAQPDTSVGNGGPVDAGGREEHELESHGPHDCGSLPDRGGFGLLGLHLSPPSMEGETRGEETSGAELSSGISDLSTPDESSLDSDIDSSASAAETTDTPSSVPSAHPSPSPVSLRSTLRTDEAEAATTVDRNSDDTASPRVDETADERLMLTPSSLADVDADPHGSESLHSAILRPATSSVFSEGGTDTNGGRRAESTYEELEYMDEEEYSALTPLRLLGLSLPLSLDSFGLPDAWEVIPLPHPPSSSSSSESSPAYSAGGTLLPAPEEPQPDGHTSPERPSDAVPQETAPSEPPPSLLGNSSPASASEHGSIPLEAAMDDVAEPAPSPSSGHPSSDSPSDNDDPIPEHPALTHSTSEGSSVDDADGPLQPAYAEPQPDVHTDAEAPENEVLEEATPSEVLLIGSSNSAVSTASTEPPRATGSIALKDKIDNAVGASLSSGDSSHNSQSDNNEATPDLPALDFHTPFLADFTGEDSVEGTGGSVPGEPDSFYGYSDAPSATDNVAGADEPPASPSSSHSNDEPTPELPALNFDTPSLTDSVLLSPEFHVVFSEYSSPEIEPANTIHVSIFAPVAPKARSRRRHARALSASHAERTSILWAPQDTRSVRGAANGQGKGKGKARARSVSDDGSDDAEAERVEREVQTEGDELRAKYARLKKELKEEREKVAGLAQRPSRVLESREAMWMANLLSWGVTNWEDCIM